MEGLKIPVHVEVIVNNNCHLNLIEFEHKLKNYLLKIPILTNGKIDISSEVELQSEISSIEICDIGEQEISYWKAGFIFHFYKLHDQAPEKDFLEGEEELPACDHWELPNRYLANLWNSIVCDGDIKQHLLGYASSAMIFTHANINPDIISWNRMILLHGPPGTGKTTLCKALAQKVFIRNSSNYKNGILLEINSHSLFSRWFSESGKLVMKLFDHINEIAEDTSALVCVLIDEIESIASARSASVRSNEPSDAVRVVNAVLTSLDSLKRRPNVLVLCTSNMVKSIDQAFLDRVDLQIYMGHPSTLARYQILHSCLIELMEKHIISPEVVLLSDPRELVEESLGIQESKDNGVKPQFPIVSSEDEMNVPLAFQKQTEGLLDETVSLEGRLWKIALSCENMSGRTLRKLPLRTHAMYLQRPNVTLEEYLNALEEAIRNFSQIMI